MSSARTEAEAAAGLESRRSRLSFAILFARLVFVLAMPAEDDRFSIDGLIRSRR